MKTFLQYGAGNIGRGFIGQLFSEAGYWVRFIDVDKEIINSLNNEKRYPINIVDNLSNTEVWVKNVDCINASDTDSVAEAIANCDLMATAVGVNVLPRIVPNIVAGFRKRVEGSNNNPLNIIICENLIDADKLLYKLISEHLGSDEKRIFDEQVGLVEASVGRMVPVMTEAQKRDNPLRVYVESYCDLPVDQCAFKGDIPEMAHLIPFTPFAFYIERKLFIHNMGHAMTAYLGHLLGYKYIWQAIDNPYIHSIVRSAMSESASALSKKFTVSLESIHEHIDDLIVRFANRALGDTIQRVGKDTARKLSANDRFAGAIRLCEEQGILPIFIPVGIAAGLLFDGKKDDTGSKALADRLRKGNLDTILTELCNLQGDNYYLKSYYQLLKDKIDLHKLLMTAQAYKINLR